MKLACVSAALLLSQPALAAASPVHPRMVFQAAAAAPQVTGTREERAAAAAAYYSQGDFVRAALGFEGLRRDYPGDKNYLFNASASRYGAGHHAHAVAFTREYLALPGLTPDDKRDAEAQLREAEANVTPVLVSVTLAPGGPGQIGLVAQYVARESGDIRPDLPFPATPGAATKVELDPGVWAIRAEGAGYATTEQRVEVTKGGQHALTLQVALAPKTVDDVPRDVPPRATDVPPVAARRAMLGLAAGGGVVAAAGIAVITVGQVGVGNSAECTKPGRECPLDLAAGLRIRGLGSAVLGAGAGLLTGGLTWLIRDPKRRRTAWIAEAAIGGAGLAAGVALWTLGSRKFNEDVNGPGTEWGDFHAAHKGMAGNAIGATLMGLGAGTLISAGTGLALQRKHLNRVQVGGMAGRGQFGLTLSGRF